MKERAKEMKSYIKSNLIGICFCTTVLTLFFYRFLFSLSDRMDTIIKLLSSEDEFNDLMLGRFGIVLLNRILGMRSYNPFLVAFLTLLTLVAAGCFLCFMLDKAAAGRCKYMVWTVPLLFFMTPHWIEQFYFSYQSFLVILGVLLLEVSVYLVVFTEKKVICVISAALTLIAFSIYQAFVPLYICMSVAVLILKLLSEPSETSKEIGRRILRLILVFFSSLILYFVINALLQIGAESTDYLSGQIIWGSLPFAGALRELFNSIASLILMGGSVDTVAYLISLILSIVLIIVRCVRIKEKRNNILLWIGWISLQLGCLSMVILLGTRSAIRSELAVPFAAAINILISYLIIKQFSGGLKRQSIRYLIASAVLLPAAICLCVNSAVSFRLIYTDEIRGQFDLLLTERVIDRLRVETDVEEESKAVVFVGEPDVTLNQSCLNGEIIGRSLFNYHRNIGATNTVILNLLSIHGLSYRDVRIEDCLLAHELAKDMPCFPENGSVKETEHTIIVKFSEDYYFDSEILTDDIKPSKEKTAELKSGEPLSRIEKLSADEQKLKIDGFQILKNVDAKEVKNRVFLKNCDTNALFEVNSACTQHLKLTHTLWRDNTNYDAGGFTALCPLSFFDDYPDTTFEILLCGTRNNDTWFVNTGSFISKRIIDRIPKTQIDKEFMAYEFE